MKDRLVRQVPDTAAERIKYIKGEGLEIFIYDMLKPYEQLGYTVEHTVIQGDFGADVLLTTPRGIRYVIQVKHPEDPAAKCDGEPVREALASKAIYKAHHAVAVTSSAGFTASAIELARANQVILWSIEDLNRLYRGSKTADEQALSALGIDTSRAEPKTFFIPRWLLPGVGLVSAAIAILAVLPSSKPPTDEEAVKAVLLEYDRAYRIAMNHNDLSELQRLTGEELFRRVAFYVEDRALRNCVLETVELGPPVVEFVMVVGDGAVAQMAKSWRQTLKCAGKQDREVLNGDFRFTYNLERSGGMWRVMDSARAGSKAP